MRLVVLVPLVTRVDLVEVARFPRPVLVLPRITLLRHLGLHVEKLFFLVEPLADRRLVDLFVLVGRRTAGFVSTGCSGARLDDETGLSDSATRCVLLACGCGEGSV